MTELTGKLLAAFSRSNVLLQCLIFSLLALALYYPVIGNSFVNDDFLVLKKVCIDKQLNTEGFFRPLSDITLYGNYWLSGFNAAAFRITNILVHALNALMVFHFCKSWRWTENNRLLLAVAGISSLFFLSYPFHNESVVWILGRASLLAACFAFLALIIMVSKWRDHWKITGIGISYFIAMTGYESVFVLPAIIFIWLLANKSSWKRIAVWMSALLLVFIVHFILRVQVSGSVTGEYGSNLLAVEPVKTFATIMKVTGRLLSPPAKNPVLFSLVAALCGLALLTAAIMFWKKPAAKYARTVLLSLFAMLILALAVPFVIGVSTNTSESDRLLYFPSFFLCIIIAFLLVSLLDGTRWLLWLTILIIVYNIFFLQLNNYNWRKASAAVTGLLQKIREKPANGKMYIINMPDELNGAYVFRVGFRDALTINRLDTVSVSVINAGIRRDLEKLPEITPRQVDGALFIAPAVLVQRNHPANSPVQDKYQIINVSESDRVVYWNKHQWVILQ